VRDRHQSYNVFTCTCCTHTCIIIITHVYSL
jgi:hypothetical protein